MLNEVKSWTSSSNFFSLPNLDTASQLQPRKTRVLLFVGANEKSDWNFSLKIKPKEMGEAPEGGWIQPIPNSHSACCCPKELFPGKQELETLRASLNLTAAALLQTQGLPAQQQEKARTKAAGGREGHHLRCYSSRVVCMARHNRMSFQTWDTP